MDHLCYFSIVFVMLSRLFIVALWSSAGKGLTSWLLFVMLNCVFVSLLCGILGQVWYLIVSIADLCPLLLLPYHKRLPLKDRISSHVGGNSSPQEKSSFKKRDAIVKNHNSFQ